MVLQMGSDDRFWASSCRNAAPSLTGRTGSTQPECLTLERDVGASTRFYVATSPDGILGTSDRSEINISRHYNDQTSKPASSQKGACAK
jgi:hypothetical protein